MSERPDPLSKVLRDTADEPRVRRLWDGIDARRRPRRRGVVPAVVVVTAAAAALIVALSQRDAPVVQPPVAHPETTSPFEPPGPPPTPVDEGPLRLADGSALESVGPSEAPSTVTLSDGSSLELAAGVRLEVLENDGEDVVFRQSPGRVRFLVRPGGPRQWVIDADLAEVTVVGTVFAVTRSEDEVAVEVERGIVRVASEHLPETARLLRGDSIRVSAQAPESASVAPPRRPRVDEDAEALMARADEARLAGRDQEAATLLTRAMSRPGDPAAGVAAFTLGRLLLDGLDEPARAVNALERALALPLPPAMREAAEARLVEAYARAGRPGDMRRAGEAYLGAHPQGRHGNEVRQRLLPPAERDDP